MLGDGLLYRADLVGRKAPTGEQLRHSGDGVGDVIPLRQRDRIGRSMADEDPEIVQPAGGKQDVIIKVCIAGQAAGQRIESRLVAEFVARLRVLCQVMLQGVAPLRHRRLLKNIRPHWAA